MSSNVLGLGRDPTQPFQDVINVDGDMAVPVDMRNIGLWLKAVFGAPATTDNEDGSFTHTFESGKTSVPSYSLEVGLPEIPQFIRFPVCAPTALLLISAVWRSAGHHQSDGAG